MSELAWQKSSHSAEAANCVCVALAPDGSVRVRDSKVPGTVVSTGRDALDRFIRAAAAGGFERA